MTLWHYIYLSFSLLDICLFVDFQTVLPILLGFTEMNCLIETAAKSPLICPKAALKANNPVILVLSFPIHPLQCTFHVWLNAVLKRRVLEVWFPVWRPGTQRITARGNVSIINTRYILLRSRSPGREELCKHESASGELTETAHSADACNVWFTNVREVYSCDKLLHLATLSNVGK